MYYTLERKGNEHELLFRGSARFFNFFFFLQIFLLYWGIQKKIIHEKIK